MAEPDGSGYGRIAVIPAEDVELTHVGAGTPMGEVLRRYWQPICLSDDLKDLPKLIRILGEDLAAFRDREGRAGLLGAHCIHRGTSLEYGRIENDGIRCCYHGWLYDTQGRCLDQPGESEHSDYKEKVRQPWYPIEEYHGLVFAYLGPLDRKPVFPRYDLLERDDVEVIAYPNYSRGIVAECNWLQIHENAADPFHTYILHSTHSGVQFSKAFAARPEVDFDRTPISVRYYRDSTLPNGNLYHRVAEIFVPNARSLPSQNQTGDQPVQEPGRFIGWWVPVDDTHTIGFHLEACPIIDGKPDPSTLADAAPGRSHNSQAPHVDYEDSQRHPDDLEAQVSQRPIVIHALENLATTDRGIVLLRQLLKESVRAVERGEDPTRHHPGSWQPGHRSRRGRYHHRLSFVKSWLKLSSSRPRP